MHVCVAVRRSQLVDSVLVVWVLPIHYRLYPLETHPHPRPHLPTFDQGDTIKVIVKELFPTPDPQELQDEPHEVGQGP